VCIDPHQTGFVDKGIDHFRLIKFWPSHAPGRGSAARRKASVQCLHLSQRFFFHFYFNSLLLQVLQQHFRKRFAFYRSGVTLLYCAVKEIIPLAWVNIPVFDYQGVLRSGEYKLHMWPVTDEKLLTEELLNPIGMSPHHVVLEIWALDTVGHRTLLNELAVF